MAQPDGQICPFHPDEFIRPKRVGETVDFLFRCPRTDHPKLGSFSWPFVPEPAGLAGESFGMGLDLELPKAVATAVKKYGGPWVEYGLFEQAYAVAQPDDWRMLLTRYDHTHYHPDLKSRRRLHYTASKYLARSLGALGARGALIHHDGPGTGRWSYNNPISFYALPPGGDWTVRVTWETSGLDMASYMPAERPH